MISIIVPIYNSDKNLHQCINSILQQTFKGFELLLINDGSTDASALICDEYAFTDTRIKVFHKENGGVSSARNIGLQNAKGEWITFIDSDDVIDKYLLSNLIKGAEDHSDFVLSGINRYKDNIIKPFFEFNKNETLMLKDFLFKYSLYQYFAGPWGKLFKNQLIKDNNISFNSSLSWGEDALFNVQYLKFCDTVRTVKFSGYNYRQLSSGLANSNFSVAYYLQLIENLKKEFTSIENKIGYIEKEKNFNIITGRLLSVLYSVSDNKQRITQLKSVYKTNKNEFMYFFAQSKGLGKICFYLLKMGNLSFFDKFYKLLK